MMACLPSGKSYLQFLCLGDTFNFCIGIISQDLQFVVVCGVSPPPNEMPCGKEIGLPEGRYFQSREIGRF